MRRRAVSPLASLAALGGVAFAMRAIQAAGKRAGVTVSVTPPHQSAVGGGGMVRFSVSLTLPRGSTRLSALVPDPAAWPQVSMHDLPTNQNACKAARLSPDYGGLATR